MTTEFCAIGLQVRSIFYFGVHLIAIDVIDSTENTVLTENQSRVENQNGQGQDKGFASETQKIDTSKQNAQVPIFAAFFQFFMKIN